MKAMKSIRLILLFFVSTTLHVLAQPSKQTHTFNIELTLPNSVTNKAFGNIMQGLVNFAPYYQYKLKNNIGFGIGARYAYFTINEFRVPEPVYGGMHSAAGFLKFGWEKFHSDGFATDFSLKGGYAQNYFLTDVNDTLGVNPVIEASLFIEPTIGLILLAESNVSFRLSLSYGWMNFGYRPQLIGLETLGGYDPEDFDRNTGYFNVGFGFTYYFGNGPSPE
jgi:hypothetical protein